MKPNTQDTKHYFYGFFIKKILPKYWFWFTDPLDVKGAAMVNFFSYNDIEKRGFYKKQGLTSVINLEQNLDLIWEKIRKKFTRNLIKEGERRGIVIKQDSNFKNYKRIYKNFRKQKGIHADRFATFRHGILFSAYYNHKMIAGHVFIGDGEYIRSWATASLRLEQLKGREKRLIGCANRMLIWEAIKFAKNNDYKIFDQGGISPDSTDKGLVNLAEFKESFGGERRKCYYYHKVYSRLLKYWMRLRGYKKV